MAFQDLKRYLWTFTYKRFSCCKETVRLLLGLVLAKSGRGLSAGIIGISSTTVTKSACKAIEFGEKNAK